MSAAALIEPASMLDAHIELLDGLIRMGASIAYPAAWKRCAEEAGAHIRTRDETLEASWLVDDLHIERGQHLRILTEHMDAADQRERVILFLRNKA